ncbi:hypothetical protein GALL_331720 [mine drainage metagenome]|uniref:Uncharacterized protein n=1 Tax=mine drainage metagenome TaxID=410659 RepID=A0A1J5R5I3_9ZZZZ
MSRALMSRLLRLERKRAEWRPTSAETAAARAKLLKMLSGPDACNVADRIDRAADAGNPMYVKLRAKLHRVLGGES